jgi:hypothetical protein
LGAYVSLMTSMQPSCWTELELEELVLTEEELELMDDEELVLTEEELELMDDEELVLTEEALLELIMFVSSLSFGL